MKRGAICRPMSLATTTFQKRPPKSFIGPLSKIKKSAVPKKGETGVQLAAPDDGYLKFSFKLFDTSDGEICPAAFQDGYTRSLMDRLRDLSSWKVSDFIGQCNKTVRNHRIDWKGTSRPDGFSSLNEQYQAYEAWQFSISANKHGRVHGIIIGPCFYIIWLDCNHVLYP